jgi:hypothetical protein
MVMFIYILVVAYIAITRVDKQLVQKQQYSFLRGCDFYLNEPAKKHSFIKQLVSHIQNWLLISKIAS